ncbi:MAG: SBBP repeat-containing protein [Candidatus Sulfotelmatobacter sp.]
MGNGRGASTGNGSKHGWQGLRAAGAGLVLVLAACGILGSGSPHRSQKLFFQIPLSPVPSVFGRSPSSSKPDAKALLGELPLIFEPNQGQADSSVKFVSRGPGYSLYLDPAGATLAMQTAKPALPGQREARRSVRSVRMTLRGANSAAMIAGNDPLPGRSNYFIGNDPRKWHTSIPQFAGVHYHSVYPGIDLVFYGSQGKLEYDFKVAPGADPSQAELQFDAVTKLELRDGDLILEGAGTDVRLQAPQVYQSAAGQRQPVEGHFVLRAAKRVGFEIGAYDRTRELVIDPTISYSTYFGGATGATSSPSIAVNGNGNIFIAGSTTTNDLPLSATTPYQSTLTGAQNVFIAELNPTLGTTGLVAMTYLGGSGTDTSVGLAVDDSNNAYVAGYTTSSNFPTLNAFQSSPAIAGTHVFVSVLNPTFSALKYSTYLSGNGTDMASGLAIDNNNDAFVTGTTTSTNVATGFPSSSLPVPFQQSPATGAPIQFFVTEVNTRLTSVNSVPYSTYFGGNNGTIAVGGGIAVDTTGNVYFSGTTNFYNSGEGNNGSGGLAPGDFPILNAYQPCLNSPPPTQVVPPVQCSAVASPEPTDAFVAKLNPNNAQTNAAQLLFSTYFGGNNDDSSTGLTIDTTASNVYITGSTQSTNFVFPTGAGVFQPCLNAPGVALASCPNTNVTNTDAYVAKFSNPTTASGSTTSAVSLGYFSYLGGSGNDSGLAVAVDTGAGALVTGATNSTDFPASTGAIQTHLNGTQQNAFFARINTTTNTGTNTIGSYATYFGGTGVDRGTSITVDPNLNTYFAGDTTSNDLQVQGAYQPTFQGTMDAFAVELRPVNGLCITCVAPVLSPASGAVSAGNPITMTFTVLNQGPDLATNVIVSGQVSSNTSATFSTASTTGGAGSICSTPAGTTASCLIPVLQAGSTVSVAF